MRNFTKDQIEYINKYLLQWYLYEMYLTKKFNLIVDFTNSLIVKQK